MTKRPKAIPTSARQAPKRRFRSRMTEPLGVSQSVALRPDAQATPAFVRPFPSSAPKWRETDDGSSHVLRAIPLRATLPPFPGHHRHSLHPLVLRSNTVCVWDISRDYPSAYRRIPPEDWRDFHDDQFAGDTILDADGQILWTDIWIAPLLYSPDVASSLADRLLRTVVHDMILKSRDICPIFLCSNEIDLGRMVSSHLVLHEKVSGMSTSGNTVARRHSGADIGGTDWTSPSTFPSQSEFCSMSFMIAIAAYSSF